MNKPREQDEPQRGPTRAQLANIERRIRELDYGEVTVVVHQGIVHEVKTLKRERQ